VARAAADPGVDVVLLGEDAARLDRITFGLPGHVGHFFNRTEVLLRIAVTIETPLHGESSDLLDRGHGVDAPVTGHAADALVHVNGVIEVDELGNLVDAVPDHRLVLDEALSDRVEDRALVPDLRMAIHTELGGRDAGEGALLDGVVAVPTVDALVSGVVPMVELQRLLDRRLHVARVRRAHPQEESAYCSTPADGEDEESKASQSVVLGTKDEMAHPNWRCI
jgi:hypothetical protein